MGLRMQPARIPGDLAESILTVPATAGQSIVVGSLVLLTTGKLTLCGADPASILGVALAAQGSWPGFSAANNPVAINFDSTNEDYVSVALANRTTIFSAKFDTGAGVLVAPTQADVGIAYGVINLSGVWRIDKSEVVNTRVRIIDYDAASFLVFFKFLEANIQTP